jgi:hypothetical protein
MQLQKGGVKFNIGDKVVEKSTGKKGIITNVNNLEYTMKSDDSLVVGKEYIFVALQDWKPVEFDACASRVCGHMSCRQ